MVEQWASLPVSGGSIPALPLHSLHVEECHVRRIQPVIERVHYTHSIFGVTTDYCFSVTDITGEVVGCAIFGAPAAYNVPLKYGPNLTELRRFVLVDECPRNSESHVLAVMLRVLRKRGIARVLSYADPAQGHEGVIYRALGFEYRGRTAKRKHIVWKGKKYPDRNLHQTKFPFHLELRAALADGTARRIEVPGKHIYLKVLK